MGARLYSSSGAGSGVVLRHRAAVADCAYFTVGAATAAQIRPPDGFLYNHCLNSRGFTKGFFLHGFL